MIRRLDGLLHGDYRTLFRGFGLDLADLREYQYHDDVRHIDWNVTARLQTPYVREYHEDREVTAWFLLDLSPSVDFGSQDERSASVSTDFVTVLARLLTRHGNRVGALFYGDRVDTVIPARSGRRHVLHLLHKMLTRPAQRHSGATNLGELLQTGFQIMPRRSLVFVVSDFISAPGWTEPLALLAQRHEIVAVRLYDPLEIELPDLGHAGHPGRRDRRAALRRHARPGLPPPLRRGRRAARAGAARGVPRGRRGRLELSTDDELVDAILRFADLRKRRSQLAAGGMLPRHLQSEHMTSSGRSCSGRCRRAGAGRALRLAPAPRKKAALRYASLAMVKEAMGVGQSLRRHVPPVLFLLALIAMLVAIGAPGRHRHPAVAARDRHPGDGRLGQHARERRGAQPPRGGADGGQAVRRGQPRHTRIGVVAFAGTAAVVQPPTQNREDVIAAIDRFQLQRGTAIGSGLIVSLATIFPDAGFDLRSANPRSMRPANRGAARRSRRRASRRKDRKPVPPGSYTSAVIILLTDGQRPPAPTRSSRRASPPTAACASTPSASAPPTARSSASKAGRSACAWTRRR